MFSNNDNKNEISQGQVSRRSFIKLAGSGLILSPFSTLAQTPKNNQKKVGVALVGLGYYSRALLAPALQNTEFCELRGIVTGTPSKIPEWQKRYAIPDSNVYSYDNMHEMANNPDIDVVYVVVPTSLHLKYALIGANAGKHVWCEKPMAMNVAQCQQMIETCAKNKVQLTVGYRMQHEPNTMRFGAYAKQQKFGDIKQIYTRAGYAGNGFPEDNWRMKKDMGGGAMYDMGVYPLNGARYLSKQEPLAITASFDKSHPHIFKEVDETTNFTLEFPNGVMADCATSIVKSYNKARIDCEDGWYQLEPMSQYSGVKGTDSLGGAYPAIKGMQQTLQMDNDAKAILGLGNILVPGEEGMKDIAIVEAAFASATTGKRVVL